MSADTELREFVRQLRGAGRYNGHRYALFLCGAAPWGQAQLASLDIASKDCLLLAENALLDLSPKRAKQYLGQEFSTVVIDAYSAQAVDDWLAAAGTLIAGGVLIVLCPEFDQWPEYFQGKSDAAADKLESSFLQRILSKVMDSSGVYCISQQGASASVTPLIHPSLHPAWTTALPTADQLSAVAAIVRVYKGRAKRPLVIRSDRGRGKTSSLGMAAAELFTQGMCQRIAMTAPNRAAVEAAFKQLQRILPTGKIVDSGFYFENCELIFMPVFELNTNQTWDLVLVDEAASLPVSVLHQLLQQHPRIVFATTVHGYEGSGRGFDIRFKDILDRERPQWRRAELQVPVRWAIDDPLEIWLNEAFLLNAEPQIPVSNLLSNIQIRVLTSTDLTQDLILNQVFGLLVQAHYQTSPRDLQYILDSSCVVLVAECDSCVVGVCQLLPEGGLDEDISAAIITGQRRPKGHLVAQRLAHLNASADYTQHVSFRVNRIAIAAECRRRGVGRQLLNAAEEYARHNNGGYLSSSFAASSDVIPFWLRNGFTALWLGSRRDTSSGMYSLIVAKALKPEFEFDFSEIHTRFLNDLPWSVRHVHADISADTLSALLTGKSVVSLGFSADLHVALRYCRQELIFEQAAAGLTRLCSQVDLRLFCDAELAIRILLLGQNWQSVAGQYQLDGRAGVEEKLRLMFNQIMAIYKRAEEV